VAVKDAQTVEREADLASRSHRLEAMLVKTQRENDRLTRLVGQLTVTVDELKERLGEQS